MKKTRDSYKGSLGKGRRNGKIEGTKRLHLGKRKIIPQDAGWGLVKVCKSGRGPKEVEGSI